MLIAVFINDESRSVTKEDISICCTNNVETVDFGKTEVSLNNNEIGNIEAETSKEAKDV